MNYSRRFFLGSAASLVGAAGCAHLGLGGSEPRLKVGVLSDIHVKLDDPASAENFRKALEDFRDRGCDAVIVAGDMADHGIIQELKMVADAWNKVFPGGKGLGGKPVERLFCYGNHDWEGWWYDGWPKKHPNIPESDKLYRDYAGNWKAAFGEDWSPVYLKTVKGYCFVGAHFDNYVGVRGLDTFLAAHADEFRGSKPFFFFQHMHPKDTCSAPWAWGQDWGSSMRDLSRFPNCIAFSGHSHTTLTDERTIWQGAFTSVGTSSLSYVCAFEGRENRLIAKAGRQGQFMTVYDDRVDLERIDFVHGETLGTWTIPLPSPGARPLAFESRAARAAAPQFDRNAAVKIDYVKSSERLDLVFPAAKGTDGCRTWDYEVTVEERVTDSVRPVAVKRWYSPAFVFAESREPREMSVSFKLGDLPKGNPFRFRIRAAECFGRTGEPLVTDWMAQPKEGWERVIAELREAELYTWMNPHLKAAFAFLRRGDLATLPLGRHEIGEGVFAFVQQPDALKRWTYDPQKVEAHRKYIDIQMPLGAEETYGNYTLKDEDLKLPFDAEKDVVFMDRVTWAYSVRPGEFAMFIPPRGGHTPCLELDGAKTVRKVVVKVPVE